MRTCECNFWGTWFSSVFASGPRLRNIPGRVETTSNKNQLSLCLRSYHEFDPIPVSALLAFEADGRERNHVQGWRGQGSHQGGRASFKSVLTCSIGGEGRHQGGRARIKSALARQVGEGAGSSFRHREHWTKHYHPS